MKRSSFVPLIVFCACSIVFGMQSALASTTTSSQQTGYPIRPTIYINGVKQDLKGNIPPSGSTVVPFRAFFSTLHIDAQFDNQTKTVTAKNDSTTVTLTAGEHKATLNGKEVYLVQTPGLSEDDDLMYVNLRFIAEAFGGVVSFDKSTLTININFPTIESREAFAYYINPNAAENSTKGLKDEPLRVGQISISPQGDQTLIEWDNHEALLDHPENYKFLKLASLSPDLKYLAIEISQQEGAQTYLVDLSTEEITNLIDDDELVSILGWEPNSDTLALHIGYLAEQNLAFYSVNEDSPLDVISSQDFISFQGGKWEHNGQFIDFIGEQPSDTFSLYRYDLKTKGIQRLQTLTRDEVNRWTQ